MTEVKKEPSRRHLWNENRTAPESFFYSSSDIFFDIEIE